MHTKTCKQKELWVAFIFLNYDQMGRKKSIAFWESYDEDEKKGNPFENDFERYSTN